MEASTAAAKLIEDYKGRKRRLGSQKATHTPAQASRRPYPLLLLPILLVPLAIIALLRLSY